jgi:hypothetical protein
LDAAARVLLSERNESPSDYASYKAALLAVSHGYAATLVDDVLASDESIQLHKRARSLMMSEDSSLPEHLRYRRALLRASQEK